MNCCQIYQLSQKVVWKNLLATLYCMIFLFRLNHRKYVRLYHCQACTWSSHVALGQWNFSNIICVKPLKSLLSSIFCICSVLNQCQALVGCVYTEIPKKTNSTCEARKWHQPIKTYVTLGQTFLVWLWIIND